jgi:hypothetical protein
VNWITYYQIQGIDNVILYIIDLELIPKLQPFVSSSFVIFVDFSYPLCHRHGKLKQRCNQFAEVNSCINRFKHYYSYILSVDLDEFVYSEKYPFKLPQAIKEASSMFSNASVMNVGIILI